MTEHPAGMPREPYAVPASDEDDAGAELRDWEKAYRHAAKAAHLLHDERDRLRAENERLHSQLIYAQQKRPIALLEENAELRRRLAEGADQTNAVTAERDALLTENERVRRELELVKVEKGLLKHGEYLNSAAHSRADRAERRLAEVEKKLQSMEGLERARKWLEEQES